MHTNLQSPAAQLCLLVRSMFTNRQTDKHRRSPEFWPWILLSLVASCTERQTYRFPSTPRLHNLSRDSLDLFLHLVVHSFTLISFQGPTQLSPKPLAFCPSYPGLILAGKHTDTALGIAAASITHIWDTVTHSPAPVSGTHTAIKYTQNRMPLTQGNP